MIDLDEFLKKNRFRLSIHSRFFRKYLILQKHYRRWIGVPGAYQRSGFPAPPMPGKIYSDECYIDTFINATGHDITSFVQLKENDNDFSFKVGRDDRVYLLKKNRNTWEYPAISDLNIS